MTAGERLVSLSGLLTGTAAAHLLAIVTGGGSGMIVNDGIAVEMAPMEVEALLADAPIVAELQDTATLVEVVSAEPIIVEICE